MRIRFQEPKLQIEGKSPYYFVRFRVYRADGTFTRKKIVIGLESEMGKREANKRKSEIIARETQRLPEQVEAIDRAETPFGEFYNERFLTMKADWSEPHRESFTYIMNTFVLPKLGKLSIGRIDKVMVQALLNGLTGYSQSTVKHVRTKMVEVFGEAHEQEYINRNPATKTVIPEGARKPDQPILTEEQLLAIIRKLTDARDRAIFMIGTFCAMRTSEVFGLPWKNFHFDGESGEAYFLINQIAYRGKRHDRTKNDASKARVPVGSRSLEALLQWERECPDTSPNALIFPSTNRNGRSRKGAPMFPATWLQKRLHPIAEELGVPFSVNFRATRRTAASLVQDHGVSLPTAQSLLRHASPTTTAQVYSKPVPESVKIAVNSFEDRVFAAGSPKLKRIK
jgi:integrase